MRINAENPEILEVELDMIASRISETRYKDIGDMIADRNFLSQCHDILSRPIKLATTNVQREHYQKLRRQVESLLNVLTPKLAEAERQQRLDIGFKDLTQRLVYIEATAESPGLGAHQLIIGNDSTLTFTLPCCRKQRSFKTYLDEFMLQSLLSGATLTFSVQCLEKHQPIGLTGVEKRGWNVTIHLMSLRKPSTNEKSSLLNRANK